MKWSYILKHWGCTLLLGTTILTLVSGFKFLSPSEIGNALVWFTIYLIFSTIYSIPTLIIYLLVFYRLINSNIDSKWIKLILISVTIAGITLTTSIIDSDMLENLTIYYSLSAVVTGILLKFRKPDLK
ncbi:hypothetical protein BV902_12900 [Sphingobacterium sp. B29]|nr:hypothetical protein BV902_12900 [Sphingobacterium sp. B29]